METIDIGYTYKQAGRLMTVIKRKRDVVMATSQNDYYEVMIVHRHNGYTIHDRIIQPAEYLPSSKQWGTYGWSYSTAQGDPRKLADRRFEDLLNR